MDDTTAQIGMPRYRCHKTVCALKIAKIERGASDGSVMIIPEECGYDPFGVTGEYMDKHQVEVGGYYIVYDDGYKSWSPAKAFEEGYEKI
jgi:hypothetical protein